MKNNLRYFVLASALLATAALTVPTATAATTLNVPFAFTVGNETCPAGHYMVERDASGSVIKLVGATQSFTWGIHPGDPSPTDSRVVLKFDDTESGHALSAIQFGPLITSRLDKKASDEARSTEIVLGR